jgi:hypothetical protein
VIGISYCFRYEILIQFHLGIVKIREENTISNSQIQLQQQNFLFSHLYVRLLSFLNIAKHKKFDCTKNSLCFMVPLYDKLSLKNELSTFKKKYMMTLFQRDTNHLWFFFFWNFVFMYYTWVSCDDKFLRTNTTMNIYDFLENDAYDFEMAPHQGNETSQAVDCWMI